ncbi:MAG: hypothetical protein RLZZ127_3187 [Planctomycetota bacterium]
MVLHGIPPGTMGRVAWFAHPARCPQHSMDPPPPMARLPGAAGLFRQPPTAPPVIRLAAFRRQPDIVAETVAFTDLGDSGDR